MATITKISDDVFNNNHPNNINEGYSQELIIIETLPIITLDKPYYFGSLRTSTVTEIISQTDDKIEFKTMNSKYLVTK
jgi:hypothetical protein